MSQSDELAQLPLRLEAARSAVKDVLGARLNDPEVAQAYSSLFGKQFGAASNALIEATPTSADGGLAALVGLGAEAALQLPEAPPQALNQEFDDAVTTQRVQAVSDLYYLYQFEALGVFRAVLTLRGLFEAGRVRLSDGPGAVALYRFDRKQALRYAEKERLQAYRRVFGYTRVTPPPGSQPNADFHSLFVRFMEQVAKFYRDKRISNVVRTRADDPSFGSIAIVRRTGYDLRQNVKNASHGHVNVLRVDGLQLLNEAFGILDAPDVRHLFGADDRWDVLEEIYSRYLGRSQIQASQRSRMATSGRNVLQWLGLRYIQQTDRAAFEADLNDIATDAEEWLMSWQALGRAGTGKKAVPARPQPATRITPKKRIVTR